MALLVQQRIHPADVNNLGHHVILRCIRSALAGHFFSIVSPVPNVKGFPGVYSDGTLTFISHILKTTSFYCKRKDRWYQRG